ncbi:methyl-accepting chemotaxis protein [uncultured Sphingomonas sp.]|uniref:methyl-accepting chemotaxis protein n=1 Tax=uncultured Sphingomonas sp. TaxID=158754 RepID=UPI0025E2000F|nr:methyl-accepting chemotaxis protein [uncultured Sphingomonas sp.]
MSTARFTLCRTPTDSAGTEWLTAAERQPLTIRRDERLATAADLFRAHPDAGFVGVVDAEGRPLGALLERDIRRLLVNPYGHALLRNPAYGGTLDDYIRLIPVADAALGVGALIAAYHAAGGHEGMILTRGGRLFATLSNRRLLLLAAGLEVERARAEAARAHVIERASAVFEDEVTRLTTELATLAGTLSGHAAATAERAAATDTRAATMTATTDRNARTLAEIGGEGRELLVALTDIADETRAAQALVADTVTLAGEGKARTAALGRSAESIGSIAQIIGGIAAEVNMLALNATIEASRAGDAGRGFAVVAGSIKQLSGQTARAADTVAGHAADVGAAIGEAASAYGRIDGAVREIALRSARIMDAAETQRRAMDAIAGHVGEAADGADAIRAEAEAVGDHAGLALRSSAAMRALAERLAAQANLLAGHARDFVSSVRPNVGIAAA